MPESIDQEIHTLQSIFWSERDPDGLAFAPLADAFRRKGKLREALDLLTDGMSRHPEFTTGHVVATRLYLDQGMHSEAELAARRILMLDPENLVALSALVSVLSERGETGEAARHKAMLLAVDPDSDEARAVADVDLGVEDAVGVEEEVDLGVEGAGGVQEEEVEEEEGDAEVSPDDFMASGDWDADDTETPLELVSDEADEGTPEITELVPETMYHDGDEALFDDLTLEPESGFDVADEGMEEGDEAAWDEADDGGEAARLAADPLDLTNLSIGHEPAGDEEDEEITDIGALAPDEEIADIGALAPEDAAEVVEMASLAPEPSVEELAEEMELAQAEESADGDGDEDSTEPVYTRTLADLYIKQGFHDKALDVLKHIQKRQPDAPDLAERIAALEKGEVPKAGFGSAAAAAPGATDAPPSPRSASVPEDPAGQGEDDVERRARELAEPHDDDHGVDTPFAWAQEEEPAEGDDDDEGIASYLDGLLQWENRGES